MVFHGELQTFGHWPSDAVTVEVRDDGRVLARDTLRPGPAGRFLFRVVAPGGRLANGSHILDVVLVGDRLPLRTTRRWHLVTVVPTPGIVLVAEPGDWDSRFLYRALKDVADLPVRGYVNIADDEWLIMETLDRVPAATVRRTAGGADLLILKGRSTTMPERSRAKGLWLWPGGEGGAAQLVGDWYVSHGTASPLSGILAGTSLDSFPPAFQITPLQAESDEWVGLQAQQGRRGAVRPIVIGGERAGRRYVTVGADGFWRWAFPGGSSEQAYRAWVSGMTTWLLGGADSVSGVAAPIAAVVANGRPVVFRWIGGGPPVPTAIQVHDGDTVVNDTLSFDGAGTARLWLPQGRFQYSLAGGASGLLAVENYSEEWLPRGVTLQARGRDAVATAGRTSARETLWLFGLVVMALAGEWLIRRRLGLR